MLTSRWIAGVAIVAVGAAAGVAVGRRQGPPTTASGAAPAAGVTGDWELGEFTVDADTTIGAAGGEITIAEGDLAGLRLSVPDAAVPDDTPVTIEHAPIVSHTWGAAVEPATPAIRIEIGDGSYADDTMTVSVPVDLADGRFALGLYVDGQGGLEGIPTAPDASGSVEVLTRHFSDWFISSFDPTSLPDKIFTGYQVARDNWQFVNRGSYTSPNGICAGMAVSSMWYFVEKYKDNDGAPPLFKQFDYPDGIATPNFGLDDADAIRFASMVHLDGNWARSKRDTSTGVEWIGSPTSWDWFRELRYGGHDRWQFEAFRYAMYLTGEPQYVTMGRTTGKGGHAIVGYGVSLGTIYDDDGNSMAGGDLWVADPNAPYSLRSIRYDSTKQQFLAYSGRLNATTDPHAFDAIGFAGKTAMFNWSLIGSRYEEMLAGTVGAGVFPTATMQQWVIDPVTGDGNWVTTNSPIPDANGQVTLAFTIPGNMTTRVLIFEDGAVAYTADDVQTPSIDQPATLSPGAGGHVYKLMVLAEAKGNLKFVDAYPLTVSPTPTTTTTTTTTTLAPPSTTLAAPVTTLPPLPPATDPPSPYDCTACPDGVGGLECRLHCESIGALP